jgi:hypothetical protein
MPGLVPHATKEADDMNTDDKDTSTKSLRLAEEYLRLGGRRRCKIDDNITTVRQWEKDPPEAERFWQERVQPLSAADRKQVEDFLPSINSP